MGVGGREEREENGEGGERRKEERGLQEEEK